MLSPEWIDLIHSKLVLTYGGPRFWGQYPGLEPEHVKRNWAHELDGVSQEGITHALHNLPAGPWPPNVLQFRELCKVRPDPGGALQVTDRPKPLTQQQRDKLRQASRVLRHHDDPLYWAKLLRERERKGEILSHTQRRMWRAALKAKGVDDNQEVSNV